VASWEHSLVQETLDSIDEVCRCQGPKVELSCFFLKHPYSAEVILLPAALSLSPIVFCDITFQRKTNRTQPLTYFSWA
jgi:hypothetical protein